MTGLIAHLHYLWLTRRVEGQRRWLARALYPNHGESEWR